MTSDIRTRDASAILQGPVKAYIAVAGADAPVLGEPFTQAVTSTITNTVVLAQIDRGNGRDFFTGTPTGVSGAAVDLDIVGDQSSAPDLRLSDITWNPAAPESNLRLIATRPTAPTPTGNLFDETYANGQTPDRPTASARTSDGALAGTSLYFQFDDKTAEIPIAALRGDYIDETTLGLNVPNASPYLEERSVLTSINPGNSYRFRIADSGGTEPVTGSNAAWEIWADELYIPEGFGVTFERETNEQGILADTAMVDAYVVSQDNEITIGLLDFRLEAWRRLMDNNPVIEHAATTTTVGYNELSMELSGGRAKQFALFLLGSSPYGVDLEGGMWWPRVYVSAVGQTTLSREGSNIPVTIRSLRDSITGHVGKFLYQTAPRTS